MNVWLTKRCSHCGRFCSKPEDELVPFGAYAFCRPCFDFGIAQAAKVHGVSMADIEQVACEQLVVRWQAIARKIREGVGHESLGTNRG